MPTTTRRESIETLGLTVLKRSRGLTPQGKAADVAGWPTSSADEGPTEELFEIREGATVASVRDALLADAAGFDFKTTTVPMYVLANILRDYAAKIDAIQETVAELLARTGLDEGELVGIRFPTVAEDQDRLVRVVAGMDARKGEWRAAPYLNADVAENGAVIARRDAEGRIEGVEETEGGTW